MPKAAKLPATILVTLHKAVSGTPAPGVNITALGGAAKALGKVIHADAALFVNVPSCVIALSLRLSNEP